MRTDYSNEIRKLALLAAFNWVNGFLNVVIVIIAHIFDWLNTHGTVKVMSIGILDADCATKYRSLATYLQQPHCGAVH